MRLYHHPNVVSRLMSDVRARQLMADRNLGIAALAASAYRALTLGRRWFVILGA